MTKQCTKCKQQFPLSEFHSNASMKDGLSHYCKPCAREASANWVRTHRHEQSERTKKWAAANRIRIKTWKHANRDRWRESGRKGHAKLKEKVFDHYGRACACCGEAQEEFLSIDHINNDGAQHKKEIPSGLYRWLIKNEFPKDFQTLCMNCNWGKRLNGICPHKARKLVGIPFLVERAG